MPLEYALQFRDKLPVANSWKHPESSAFVALEPGELGVDNLPNQVVSRRRAGQYRLNVMIVGESGLGKSTFINTLFASDLLTKSQRTLDGKTVEITPHDFVLQEDGVELHLSVIDTPGFGDQLDRSNALEPILQYIDSKYNDYFEAESAGTFRRNIVDNRVHCILYFINPSWKKIKELDLLALKMLSEKSNVIPILAKADTLTVDERKQSKAAINSSLSKVDIKLYPNISIDAREYLSVSPFCIVGADTFTQINGEPARVRRYRWGFVDVENEEHCDFVKLREMLMSKHLQDIIELSHSIHYFGYRMSKLRAKGRPISILASDDQFEDQIDTVKKQFEEEMAQKESEMRENLFHKIKDKEAEMRVREETLAKTDRDFTAQAELQMQQLEAEEREIELAIQRSMAGKKGRK